MWKSFGQIEGSKGQRKKACVVNTASPWRPPCLPSSCSRSGTRQHWVASVTVGPLATWMGCPTKVSCKSTSALGAISLGRAVWLLFPVDGCVWIILAGRMAGWIYGWTKPLNNRHKTITIYESTFPIKSHKSQLAFSLWNTAGLAPFMSLFSLWWMQEHYSQPLAGIKTCRSLNYDQKEIRKY